MQNLLHFDFTITLGNVLTMLTIVVLGLKLHRIVMMFLLEHDLLIQEYCERNGIDMSDLPTRLARKRGRGSFSGIRQKKEGHG